LSPAVVLCGIVACVTPFSIPVLNEPGNAIKKCSRPKLFAFCFIFGAHLKSNIHIMRRITFVSIICFLVTNIDCTKPIGEQPSNAVNSATEQSDAKGKTVIYLIKKVRIIANPTHSGLLQKVK
jgi:hypothetical protein